jgi:hypothetical protein
MAHFAKIDNNNIVTEVIVAEQSFINSGLVGDSFLWIQTSYNDNFRKQFAGAGCTYDKDKDVFIRPQTYPSWVLNDDNDWEAPVKEPVVGDWTWDEETTNWKEIV